MSLRNRARSLQKKTGLSYQQALAKLRALGERPAVLSKKSGWSLEVCDRFLIDGHAPIDVIEVAQSEIPSLHDLVQQTCEKLLRDANALAVVVSANNGRLLAHAGAGNIVTPSGGAPADLMTLWRAIEPRHKRPVEPPEVLDL